MGALKVRARMKIDGTVAGDIAGAMGPGEER
jgi:hypothetical protein